MLMSIDNFYKNIDFIRSSNNHFPISKDKISNLLKTRLKPILNNFKIIEEKNLNNEEFKSLFEIKNAVYDIYNFFGIDSETRYKNIKLQTSNENKITIITTTCKRINLFKKTIDSFLECCLDLQEHLNEWIIIDDQSEQKDIEEMKNLYPFLKIVQKDVTQKGHAKSMNMIKDLVKTEYFIILEDDWEFVIKDNYITKSLNIFKEDEKIKQVLFNINYAEDLSIGPYINSSEMKYTTDGQRYFIHKYLNNQELQQIKPNYLNCHYWPHFSFRVGLTKTHILNELGNFNVNPGHFEMEYAFKYLEKGYITTFLDTISAYHTGRRTYERNSDKQNAYDLNQESQFGQKIKDETSSLQKDLVSKESSTNNRLVVGSLNGKEISVSKQYNIKSYVINLEKRPERLFKFVGRMKGLNFVNVYDGIDGKKLKPNQKIQKLCETGDYNYRRGIIGCALSHINLWIDFINNPNFDYVLILEDDAILVDNFHQKLEHLLNSYGNEFDVLYLGMFPYQNKKEWHYTSENQNVLPTARKWNKKEIFETSMGGNHGYILSKKGALNCLEYLDKNGMTNAIDWMIMHTADINKIYYSEPFIIEGECVQTGGSSIESDIQREFDSVKYDKDEFFENELIYWKEKCMEKINLVVDKSLEELKNEDFEDKITIIRYDNIDFKNLLKNIAVKYYTANDYLFIVDESLITKEILKDKTFGGYLNSYQYV